MIAGLSETFSPNGKIPAYLNGGHYGPTLIRFALYQYYHCHVTQPLLLEQLHELDIDISTGQLNNFLIENKERFHQEKDHILAVGLQVSSYINVDDTGQFNVLLHALCWIDVCQNLFQQDCQRHIKHGAEANLQKQI